MTGWDWDASLVTMLVMAVGGILLLVINLPRSMRYAQRSVPVAALVVLLVWLGAIAGISRLSGLVEPLGEAVHWLLDAVDNHAILPFMGLAIGLLFGFVVIKVFLLGVALIGRIASRVRDLVFRKGASGAPAPRVVLLGPAPGYRREPGGELKVKPGWQFIRDLAWYCGVLTFSVLLLLLLFQPSDEWLRLSQRLPLEVWLGAFILLAVVLLELAWYLGGDESTHVPDQWGGRDAVAARDSSKRQAISIYQRAWPTRLLIKGRIGWDRHGLETTDIPDADSGKGLGPVTTEPERGSLVLAGEDPLVRRLESSDDVVITGFDGDVIGFPLFAFFSKRLARGERILLLLDDAHANHDGVFKEVGTWLKRGFEGLEDGKSPWNCRVGDIPPTKGDHLWAITLEGFAQSSCNETLRNEWLTDIGVVVFVDTEGKKTPLARRYAVAEQVRRLPNRKPRTMVLAGYERNLASANEENLKLIRSGTYSVAHRHRRAHVWVWRLDRKPEEEPFEDALAFGAGVVMGAELALAVPALSEGGSTKAWIVESQEVPFQDGLEGLESQRNRGRLLEEFSFPPDRLERSLGGIDLWSIAPAQHGAVLIARDEIFNFPLLINKLNCKAGHAARLHVLTTPHLLREYFSAHSEFFLKSPLEPLEPAVTDMSRTVAERLLHQLLMIGLEPNSVKYQLRDAGILAHEPMIGLFRLFRKEFGVDLLQERYLLEKDGRYLLRQEIKNDPRFKWVQPCKIVVTDAGPDDSFGVVAYEHIYQRWLPGQFHVFGGRLYRVEHVTEDALQLERSQPAAELYQYRTDMEVNISIEHKHQTQANTLQGEPIATLAGRPGDRAESIRNGIELATSLCTIPKLQVITNGYWEWAGEDVSTYHRLYDIPRREYTDARGLLVVMGDEAGQQGPLASASISLALLLKGLLPTLFPDRHGFCLVLPLCGSGRSHEHRCGVNSGGLGPTAGLLPSTHWWSEDQRISDPGPAMRTEEKAGVLIAIDSHSDLGVVQALHDHMEYVMGVVHDYLVWRLDEGGDRRPGDDENWQWWPDNMRPLLPLELGDVPEGASFDVLKQLLDRRHARGNNLTIGRRRFFDERAARFGGGIEATGAQCADAGATGPEDVEELGTKHLPVCNICGAAGSADAMEQLVDGRRRCPVCRRDAVDQWEKAKELYGDAVRFIESRYGMAVPGGGSIRVTDAVEIGDRTGRPFSPTPEFDGRAIGCAIFQPDQRWEILIEVGLPDYVMAGVFAHELTHVWQYWNLNLDEIDLTWIEGHARWVEAQYLTEDYRVSPHAAQYAARLEAQEQSPYGPGLRQMTHAIQAQGGKNPFQIMLERHGREI